MSETVRVELGACRCPGAPHEGDWAEVDGELGVLAGAAAMAAMSDAEPTAGEVEAAVTGAIMRRCIQRWSLTSRDPATGRDEVLPVNGGTIAERLSSWEVANPLVTAIGELYAEALYRPLARRLAASSSGGPTEPSTSAPTGSGGSPRRPSSPSSPTDSAAGRRSADPAR